MGTVSAARKPSRRLFGLTTRLVIIGLIGLMPALYAGYRYIGKIETFLLDEQKDALLSKAQAFASVLYGQRELFAPPQDVSDAIASTDINVALNYVWDKRNLIPFELSKPITLDGDINDWREQTAVFRERASYAADNTLTRGDNFDPFSMSFEHVLGRYGDYIYALFIVDDDQIVYRNRDSLSLDKSDHLQISMTNANGVFRHYKLAPFRDDVLPYSNKPVWLNAYLMESGVGNNTVGPETQIQGVWAETVFGYNLELRIHRSLLGDKLAFAVADVDRNTTGEATLRTLIGTAGTQRIDDLGTVLVGSPRMAQTLQGFHDEQRNQPGSDGTRMWVANTDCTVRAFAGSLTQQSPSRRNENSLLTMITQTVLNHILTQPHTLFTDPPNTVPCLSTPAFQRTLINGTPQTGERTSPDTLATILTAFSPVFDARGDIIGIVAAERSLNTVLSERNTAIEQLVSGLLAAFILSLLILLAFALWLSRRIRLLSYAAKIATSTEGRIIQSDLPGKRWHDEIGDLSRTLSTQFHLVNDYTTRLEQYNSYLHQYKDKLRHEMQTPTSLVQTSLELLGMEQLTDHQQRLLIRAKSGADSLSKLLKSLSEAKNVEGAVENEPREPFNLTDEMTHYIDSYSALHPNKRFTFRTTPQQLWINGASWLIRQMLDKLLDNAVEFSSGNESIDVVLAGEARFAIITVTNYGSSLPTAMQAYLFDFMVSIRRPTNETPHLGLGLYMAKLIAHYHNGTIEGKTHDDGRGVTFTIRLPLYKRIVPLTR